VQSLIWIIGPYGIVAWVLFVTIVFCLTRLFGWPGLLLGHCLMTAVAVGPDLCRMELPQQGSSPAVGADFRPLFSFIERVAHTAVLNGVLFPISLLALHIRARRREYPLPAKRDGQAVRWGDECDPPLRE
jgi:hypothetical protein